MPDLGKDGFCILSNFSLGDGADIVWLFTEVRWNGWGVVVTTLLSFDGLHSDEIAIILDSKVTKSTMQKNNNLFIVKKVFRQKFVGRFGEKSFKNNG